jgi:hypothetical protein
VAPEKNYRRAIDYRLGGTIACCLLQIYASDLLGFNVQNDTPAVDIAYRSHPLPVPRVADWRMVDACIILGGNTFAQRRRPRPCDQRRLEEVFLTIKGERHSRWWAVAGDSYVLDIRVAGRRDQTAERHVILAISTLSVPTDWSR